MTNPIELTSAVERLEIDAARYPLEDRTPQQKDIATVLAALRSGEGKPVAWRVRWIDERRGQTPRRPMVTFDRMEAVKWEISGYSVEPLVAQSSSVAPLQIAGEGQLPAGFLSWLGDQADDASCDLGAFRQEGGGDPPEAAKQHAAMLAEAFRVLSPTPGADGLSDGEGAK